jgi:DNA replication protein DnaC
MAIGGAAAKVASILRQRGLDPAAAAFTEDRPDDTSEYQAEVYRQAWENSLRRAGHTDYIRYRLAHLDENDQHPAHLKKYIDQHVEARAKQRQQQKLPPEQRQFIRPNILNLIMPGTVGTGKTVAAVAAGEYAVSRGLMARFVTHSMYLSWLRPDGAPSGMTALKVVEFYERCDVLVLDDLGNEMDGYATTFVRTATSDLITARINSGRPTIFTTNLNSAQIAEILGDRLASRIGTRAAVLKVVGSDRRAPQTW